MKTKSLSNRHRPMEMDYLPLNKLENIIQLLEFNKKQQKLFILYAHLYKIINTRMKTAQSKSYKYPTLMVQFLKNFHTTKNPNPISSLDLVVQRSKRIIAFTISQ
ncbi:hypothetical protein PanWU01x14_162750 [Parasponia andersonii]|uniref:Uncharacterized protein n=1 Tax=Parasponia andersonii TaxID=3476 RepID=A0A2P5CD30_PARAD|nr:hypothetical protein PanWU01x14_162750 [Parasponia andersonii]